MERGERGGGERTGKKGKNKKEDKTRKKEEKKVLFHAPAPFLELELCFCHKQV